MPENGTSHDIRTLVKILAPREVGVTLVPLSQIEEAESAFFWASVFLAAVSSILGAVISLFTTGFTNKPVVYLLLIFLGVFAILFLAFANAAFSRRRKARTQSPTSSASLPQSPAPERSSEHDDDVFVGLLYKGMHFLREKIFVTDNKLPETDVLAKWPEVAGDSTSDPASRGLYEDFIQMGMMTRDVSDPSCPMINFNSDFSPEKYASRTLGGK